MKFDKYGILALLAVLCAACAPATPTAPAAATAPAQVAQSSQPTAAAPAVESPRPGGVLRIISSDDPASFDLHQEASILALSAVAPAYSGLVTVDAQDPQKITGDLAQTFEVSPDGLAYTFHFYPNIKWHDGVPFTSEDARYSFERMRNPPQGVRSPRAPDLAVIDTLEAPDPATLKITLKRPSSAFLIQLTSSWFVVLPKHILESKGNMLKEIVGTGPFMFKAYQPGVSLELVKNPDYFRAGMPYLDGVTTLFVKDAGTRVAALRAGQADMTARVFANLLPSDAEALANEPGVRILHAPGLGGFVLHMNPNRKPFDDARVRQAIAIGFDRDTAIKTVGQGSGTIGTFLPPGPWALSETEIRKLPGFQQPKSVDVDQAKKLLADAGQSGGLKTTILTRTAEQRMAQYWQAQLKLLGIDASIDLQDQAVLAQRQSNNDFDLMATSGYWFSNDPSELARKVGADAPQNYARYANPRIIDLLGQLESTRDTQARLQTTRQLDDLLLTDGPNIIPYWEDAIVGLSARVRGYPTPPNQYTQIKYDTVWLAQ
jgi:peptide/nickel transport system substrate-binding protein